MSSNITKPAFITFTGIDRAELLPGMRTLSQRFAIEWGVLLDVAQRGQPLFPGEKALHKIQASGLRLSAHVCGAAARAIVEGQAPQLDLGGFSRVQINHGRAGSSAIEIAHSAAFGRRHNIRPALQCQGAFPTEPRVDWLYDVSFGTGAKPAVWPPIVSNQALCGYSGGLGPLTVAEILPKFSIAAGAGYWIDMESGVRTDGQFDLEKCAAVCEIVFGRDAA